MTSLEPSGQRGTQVFLAAIIALAAIGFMVGLDDGAPRGEVDRVESVSSEPDRDSPPAVTYGEIGSLGPAATQGYRNTVADLGVPQVDLTQEIPVEPEKKAASLAERATRRAYNGAPPVIPHAVDQMSDGACVACHAVGVSVAAKTAPIIPHSHYTNCQQCHSAAAPVATGQPLAPNAFRGLAAPMAGERAWEGAPPTIPHSTWMRENCMACHGPLGKPGMRTSHPGRENCLQCHGRSAIQDPLEPTTGVWLYEPPPALLRGRVPDNRPSNSDASGAHR